MVFDIHRCWKSPNGNESRAYICLHESEKAGQDESEMGRSPFHKLYFERNLVNKRKLALGYKAQNQFVYSLRPDFDPV